MPVSAPPAIVARKQRRRTRFCSSTPDAVLQPDTLAELAKALTAHPDVDLFSPRIIDSAGNEYYRHRTILLPRPYLLKPPVPRADAPIRMFSGAAVCVRTAAFRAIGGFDENIFLYYEDDDLAARMIKAGRKMRYVYDAIVLHDPTRSTVDTPEIAIFREFSAMRSRLYTLRKHKRPTLVWMNLPRDIARLAKARIGGNVRGAALIRARISAMLGRKGPPKP